MDHNAFILQRAS